MMSLTHHVDVPVGVLFDPVLSHTVLCLLVAGYLEIKPKKGQVASIECIYRGNITLSDFDQITTTAYQMFPFVSDSIKLGRACSSNVYRVQRTKAEVIFMTIYAIDCTAPNPAMWPLLQLGTCVKGVNQALSPLPLSAPV